MGYDTYFSIRAKAANKAEAKAIMDEVYKMAEDNDVCDLCRHNEGGEHDNVTFCDRRWGSHDGDIEAISRRHPDAVILINGSGEEDLDYWNERWRGGAFEQCVVDAASASHFTEILLPEEEEAVFAEADGAYVKALAALRAAALTRLRTLKDRITGHPGCCLSIREMNNELPQCSVSYEVPCLNREHVLLLVDGISDDATYVTTEEDDVYLNEMSTEDLRGVVSLLEGYVKEIAGGKVTGSWDEDEEVYSLRYAA